jgi:ketosteroid isomerase-like protein
VRDAEGFVRRFADAWADPDPDRLAALLASDVRLVQPLAPDTVGVDAARAGFARLLALLPDLRAEVHGSAAGEDHLFIDFTLSATFGGRRVTWPAVDRFRLRDGLAAERVSYFDPWPLVWVVLTRPRGWRTLVRARSRR